MRTWKLREDKLAQIAQHPMTGLRFEPSLADSQAYVSSACHVAPCGTLWLPSERQMGLPKVTQ